MPKRSFSGISKGHTAAVKRRKMLGGAKPATIGKSLTAKVNQLLNAQELKNFDVNSASLSVVATGTVVPLNNILAGDDSSNRNGRRIAYVSSMFRWHGFITDGTPQAPLGMRVCLVYDRQPNGTAPVWTDVFTLATSDSDRNVTNRDRFQMLYDNYLSAKKGYLSVSTPSSAGGAGFESGLYDQVYTKMTPLTSEYATTAAAIPTHGGVFLMALTDGPGTMRYYHRLNFNDS